MNEFVTILLSFINTAAVAVRSCYIQCLFVDVCVAVVAAVIVIWCHQFSS